MYKHLLLLFSIFMMSLTGVQVVHGIDLIPGGENVVFEMKTDGLIVTGSYDVKNDSSIYNPSKHSDIIKGDIIKKVEGYKISSVSEFINAFNRFLSQNEVDLTLKRKDHLIERSLKVIPQDNGFKTGLYVKERLIGIGTMSFYDPVNKIYGALGHEVIDSDTKEIFDIKSGTVYQDEVIGITKGSDGHPGEKNSEVTLEDSFGSITANTEFGIFGTVDEIPSNLKPIKMASKDEVKLGKAQVLTNVKGDTVKSYSIEITSLKPQNEIATKGISFKITDSELIKVAGGVFSGMSGSPIIQNEMIVGAVTHVLIDNIKCGYGVYMEYMYQVALSNSII